MCAKALAISPLRKLRSSGNPVYRYAFGASLILVVALAMDYTMAFLTPVLALTFLGQGSQPLSLKAGLGFIAVLGVSNILAVVFSNVFLAYPLVFTLLLGLIIYHVFYTDRVKAGIKIWLLVSLLVLPLLSTYTKSLGTAVSMSLLGSSAMAVLLVWLVYFMFPDKAKSKASQTAPAPTPSRQQRATNALEQIIVVFPVVIAFYIFQWSGAILVLVFIAILAMNPAARNPKLGLAMILANFVGGLASILVFNFLTVVPNLFFLGLLVLFFGLLFGNKLFTKSPTAALYGMAFSTFILVLGSVTTSDGDAGEKVWERLFQIFLAVSYVVLAFKVLRIFFKPNTQHAKVG